MPTYTVTLSGPERRDGEKPFDYVVDAESLAGAVQRAVHAHLDNLCVNDHSVFDPDLIWVERCVPGVQENGYFNDLRKKGN